MPRIKYTVWYPVCEPHAAYISPDAEYIRVANDRTQSVQTGLTQKAAKKLAQSIRRGKT